MELPYRGSGKDYFTDMGVSPKEALAHVNLGSYLTSLCLGGKWAKDGTHLIRSLIIMPYVMLDSCREVTPPLLNTLEDRELTM